MAWVQSPVASTSTSASVSVSPTSPTFGLHSLSLTVPTSLSAHLAPPPSHQRYHSPQQQHQHLPPQQQQRAPRPPSSVVYAMAPPPVPMSNRKRKSYTDVRSSASPAPESSASPSSHAEEGDSEYDPSRIQNAQRAPVRAKRAIQAKPAAAPATPSAPAQKLGPGGRPMSREQLRKANHSLIERRRREKINAALSDLREMVPGLGGEGAGGKGGEFKLEVLERTVEHMRELKAQVEDMQTRLVGLSSAPKAHKKRRPSDDDVDMDDHDDSPPRRPAHTPIQPHSGSYQTRKPAASSTPPSPSVTPPLHHTTVLSSPDPNETEPEFDLPPPLAMASKRVSQDDTSSSARTASPHPPSIASLLASSAQSQRSSTAGSTQRSSAGPNPNIYLPFPTPSPSSPFLTYHPSSASTASSATGPPEPSPFMAPLQNISLFGGALDSSASPYEGPASGKQPSPPDLVMPPPSSANGRDMAPEEAANLLLAISSPDTLHPTRTGTTPLMSAVSGRSRALESEDFTLDGGVASVTHARTTIKVEHGQKYRPQGKTARDILRM